MPPATTAPALVCLTQVDFRSGMRHEMAAVNRRIHAAGAVAIWDLSHSAGAFPVTLDDDGSDFAVGCSYKYLNGGSGAPAWIDCARRWHDGSTSRCPAGSVTPIRSRSNSAIYRPAARP